MTGSRTIRVIFILILAMTAGAIALLTIGVNFVVDWMLAIHSKGQGEGA